MNQVELLGELRELIGNPSRNDVSDKQLMSSVIPALEWLACELKYPVVQDDLSTALVADRYTYQLPEQFASMVRVEFNDVRLEPTSIYAMDRLGTNWRHGTSGTPAQYAIDGDQLILQPAPGSDAIATDPTLSIRYMASSPGLSKAGTPGLLALDQQLVRYAAAIEYLSSRPSDENQARIQNYTVLIDKRLLPAARRRNQNAIEDYQPRFRPDTTGRSGGAR